MFTKQEQESIFRLASQLTGVHPDGPYRPEIFLTNVAKRMRENGFTKLEDYLKFAEKNSTESAKLVSSLSIHTTSWFRENPHFVILQQILLSALEKKEVFRVWSAACSSGEEVYSIGLMLAEFQRINRAFEYSILGTDIDPMSIATAQKAIYPSKSLLGPVAHYKNQIFLGSGPTDGFFTFSKDLRTRCHFQIHDIRKPLTSQGPFHLIMCRNVLIYFSKSDSNMVIHNLTNNLVDSGHIVLGHSEIIQHQNLGLNLISHAVYQKINARASSQPKSPSIPRQKQIQSNFAPDIILIGASTGGPVAIPKVLRQLPPSTPPIVIVQHISPQFVDPFAEHLMHNSGLKRGEVSNGSLLLPGHFYICNQDAHIGLQIQNNKLTLLLSSSPPVGGHRPSVDFLFHSACNIKKSILAILLTGMGKDGAIGLDSLHSQGAYTIAQSEDDCAVFGMPKEAIKRNAVDFVGNTDEINKIIFDCAKYTQDLKPSKIS